MFSDNWLYIDLETGRLALDREFIGAEEFESGIARVAVGDRNDPRIGYIDHTGQYIWYPTH
jgi:hypothetical protein